MIRFLIALVFSCLFASCAQAQTTCNPGTPWVTQFGTMTIGDQLIYGPNCNQFQSGGAPVLGNQTQFYIDNVGNDNNPCSILFPCATAAHCITLGYQQLLTRNFSCIFTAGQIFTEPLYTVFFAKSGFGGEAFFQSSIPGTSYTLRCAPGQTGIVQIGDIGILIVTDATFDSNFNSCPHTIIGHNYGVLDTFANTKFIVNNGDLFTCDFDFHINVNNGFQYTAGGGTITRIADLGPNCIMVLQGAITHTGTSIISLQPFRVQTGAKLIIEGNVSWSNAGLTASNPSIVGGTGTIQNQINVVPPGGTPVPVTNGTGAFGPTGSYCGLATVC